MINFNVWVIFGIIAIILLIVYWNKRNAVWGGLTIGVILGFIIAIFYLLMGNEFNWLIIGKVTILGTIIGFVAELLGKAFDFFEKNNKK